MIKIAEWESPKDIIGLYFWANEYFIRIQPKNEKLRRYGLTEFFKSPSDIEAMRHARKRIADLSITSSILQVYPPNSVQFILEIPDA